MNTYRPGRNFSQKPQNFKRKFSPRNRFNNQGANIDPARFVKKAAEQKVEEAYVPKHTFADFNIEDALKKNILERHYVTPTPIQDQSIPHIIDGRDVIGIANTGTGKTAAFLIPLINKVLIKRTENVIIIVPTRELGEQIEQELRAFAKFLNIYSALCIGGAFIGKQISDLRRNPHFVIGTPGRLKDLIERKVLTMSKFGNIVLDEADRMVDMGFINDIKAIIAKLPASKQSLFFSATLTPQVETLMKTLLKDPVHVKVKSQETAHNVDQDVVKITDLTKKIDTLVTLLKDAEFKKVIIFGRTKHGVEKLSKELFRRGFKALSIHGNKTQSQRQKALAEFKSNRSNILIATDVAARGLDIADISHVINYDVPATFEDYVHRIGRTGRANKKGKALTFVHH